MTTVVPPRLAWPQRLRLGLALGGAGLITCAAIFGGDPATWGRTTGSELWFLLWFLAASAVGAFAAGLATAGLFGGAGGRGWAVAGFGSLLSTGLGGALGGTLVLPGLGTIWGALIVGRLMVERPVIVPIWACAMAAVHLYARRLRGAGGGAIR